MKENENKILPSNFLRYFVKTELITAEPQSYLELQMI